MQELRLRHSPDGKECLYHGMATNLRARTAWHAEQKLTLGALKSGFLSTFRFTLLVLNGFDYLAGSYHIDRFMDGLSLSWLETKSLGEANDAEKLELSGQFHYPLNIAGNNCPDLSKYLSFLRGNRKEYKNRYVK
jgi:hypothetical protein